MKYCYPQRFNRVSFLASGGIFPAVMDNGCRRPRIFILGINHEHCSGMFIRTAAVFNYGLMLNVKSCVCGGSGTQIEVSEVTQVWP